MPLVLQEMVSVEGHNATLIWLRHVSEDHIHHTDKHSVLERMPSILDDWNNIGSRFCHIDEVASVAKAGERKRNNNEMNTHTPWTMRELDSVDTPRRTNNVRHM
jgi:hypothetical protein